MTSEKTFFNEGSSFRLICLIPLVITHTQELLYAFIARFDLRVPGFYQSDHPRQRNQPGMSRPFGALTGQSRERWDPAQPTVTT